METVELTSFTPGWGFEESELALPRTDDERVIRDARAQEAETWVPTSEFVEHAHIQPDCPA